MAVHSNDLRLTELATGEGSGTWGETTNSNLELIAEAFSFGTEAITTNADTHTTTIADGSTDPGRSLFLKYTGTLDSACTITIGPNTVSKLWLIENATSGGFSIIIKQGSGATVTVPNGQTKAIYSDGAGSGGAMVDAFAHLNVVDLTVEDDLTITDDLTVGGTLGVTGVLTANAGVVVDNITIDGTEIDLSSGNLTLDVAGNIILDADGGSVFVKDAGTTIGAIENSSSDFSISSSVSDKDILFKGVDGASVITALTLDMSAAGAATFNSSVTATSLDISGDIDVDGTTNLDVVDIDGAVAMASTLVVGGTTPRSGFVADFQGTSGNAVNIQTGDEASDISLSVGSVSTPDKFVITAGGSVTASGVLETNSNIRISEDKFIYSYKGGTNGQVRSGFLLDGTNQSLDFYTAQSERATIDSSGNFLVNRTSVFTTAKMEIQSDSGDASTLALNSIDTDGSILELYKAGSSVGSVGAVASQLFIVGGDTGLQLNGTADQIRPCDASGAARDAAIDLGDTTRRFKDLYLSGGLPGTASGELVINDNSVDFDFRVESNGNANMLFVDAGNDRVGVGVSAPQTELFVRKDTGGSPTRIGISNSGTVGSGTASRLSFYEGNTESSFIERRRDGTGDTAIVTPAADNPVNIEVNGGNELASFTGSAIIFNEDSGDQDFRVESNDETNMLIVDAGENEVKFGSNFGMQSIAFAGVRKNGAGFEFGHANNTGGFYGTLGSFGSNGHPYIGFSAFCELNANTFTTSGFKGSVIEGNSSGHLVFNQLTTASGTGQTPLERMTMGTSEFVHNESGSDYDFRVESDNNANMLFVDAGNDAVSVGGSVTDSNFSVSAMSFPETTEKLTEFRAGVANANYETNRYIKLTQTFTGSAVAAPAIVWEANANGSNEKAYGLIHTQADGSLSFQNIGAKSAVSVGSALGTLQKLLIGIGEAVFNEQSLDYDFRVESDTNANAFFLDATNGNIGMGGASTIPLNIFRNGAGNTELLRLTNNNTNNHNFYVYVNDDDNMVRFGSTGDNGGNFAILEPTNTNDSIIFFTAGGATFNERGVDSDFRVESDGNANMLFIDAANDEVVIGKSSGSTSTAGLGMDVGSSIGQIRIVKTNSGTHNAVRFYHSGSNVGNIQYSDSATSYLTSSDQRLKDNIQDAADAGELIDAIQVRSFDWKADGEHQRYGMVAQELNTVAPEAVSIPEGPDEMMGVDYSKLVPMLIKEIQSLRNRVAELEGE